MTLVKPVTVPTRMGSDPSSISLDADTLALIQRGIYKNSSFFGDQSGTSSHSSFTGGMNIISMFSGFAQTLSGSTVAERDPTKPFALTQPEYDAVIKRSSQIATYGNVPQDNVQDLLFMMIGVNNTQDMQKVADAVQLPELANASILQDPMAILNVPGLEKIAFMASALSALLKSFTKYQNAQSGALPGMDDIGSILGSLSSLLGGFGEGTTSQLGYAINTPAPNKALGHFMSELVTGKRIPMSVIAKNPQLQSPSFIGKALFGEAPIALSNVDMTQIFSKKIGVFPKPSSGGATTSFGMSNFNSFGSSMNVSDLISQTMFGETGLSAGSAKYDQQQSVLSIFSQITGASGTDSIETNRADHMVPALMGLSGGMSGLEKAPFSVDTFQQSWITSMSASNALQQTSPSFMEAIRKLV